MKWEAKAIKHNKEKRIAIYFEKDATLIARVKKLTGVRWSATLKAWHVPDNTENRERFKIAPELILNDNHTAHIKKFEQWLYSKRYSASTIKTYTEALKSFLFFFNTKPIEEITNEDIIIYNNDFILKNKLSASYQNQIVNAVKLFFRTIINKMMNQELIH